MICSMLSVRHLAGSGSKDGNHREIILLEDLFLEEQMNTYCSVDYNFNISPSERKPSTNTKILGSYAHS